MGVILHETGPYDDLEDDEIIASFIRNRRRLFTVTTGHEGTASAVDVAAYIIETYGPQDAIRLQKLLYFCQAKRLADAHVPLFGEQMEAWKFGPVVRRVYGHHRGNHRVRLADLEPEHPDPNALTRDERRAIDEVVDLLKHHSQWDLMEISHQGSPWREARGQLPPEAVSEEVVEMDGLADDWADRIWPELRAADHWVPGP